MFHIKNCSRIITLRSFCSGPEKKKKFIVTVVGAAGGVGQFLTYGLKFNKHIKQLRLYDIDKKLKGIAEDVGHINTTPVVKTYEGEDNLRKSLICADVVAICAGKSRKPGMKSEDLFEPNAKIIQKIVPEIANAAPHAIIAIFTAPVNMLVPMAAAYLEQEQAFKPKRLFGVTKLYEIRARTFLAEQLDIPPNCVKIPVIGGFTSATVLPVLSNSEPANEFSDEEAKKLVEKIISSGDKLLAAKGTGSSTLAAGWAGTCFISSILSAMSGKRNVLETAFVQSDIAEVPFFASPIVLGKCGVEEVCPLPDLNEMEEAMLKNVVSALAKDISKVSEFVKKNPAVSTFGTSKKNTETKKETKKETKNENKKETKNQTKKEPKKETKNETKKEPKKETKCETKNETKKEPKKEPKKETKKEPKKETKCETKNETNKEPKKETKNEPKKEPKNEPKK